MSSMSTILNGATLAQDADSATVFASILNNDLHAIKALGGRNEFASEDALRISRIWSEYQAMDAGKTTKRTPVYQRPATGLIPTNGGSSAARELAAGAAGAV